MKISVCFSGFSAAEAESLRAEAGKMDSLWEYRFEPDVAATRSSLAGQTCDALVVNMSAQAAGAVDLLRSATGLNPAPLRFIVGGVDDQSVVINNIGGSHHFIRRPFEPADLLKNIQRGLKLDTWLSTAELRALAPRLRRLPSLPATYFNLLKEIESPAATLQGIASVIARDPAATARLLQTVNSAAFSPAEKVAQPMDAVALMGVQTVKSIVLCLQVFGQDDEARAAGLVPEIIWEHSQLVAKFARQITLKQTSDAHLAEEAFTVGLLHDVGRIVMATNLSHEYAAVVTAAREKSRPLHEEETAQFGVNHAKVGAYLLGLWGLPASYIEAVAAHHAPGQTAFAQEFSILSAVHAANVFAHEMSGQTDGLALPQLDLAYYQTIKLDDQLPAWRQACTGEPPPPVEKPRAIPSPTPQNNIPATSPATLPPARKVPAWWIPAGGVAVALTLSLVWLFWPRTPSAPQLESSPAGPPSTTQLPAPEAAAGPSVATTAESPKPTEAKPAPPSSPANPLDSIRIQGILYRQAKPVVIINNKSLTVGDSIAGVRVVAISQSAVTLSFGDQQRTYPVK
jgi:HD-like signal output (HDOD) protein